MSEDGLDFAARLRRLIDAAGQPTLETISRRAGTLAAGGTTAPSVPTISEWRTGRSLPKSWDAVKLVLDALIEMAQARGVAPDPPDLYRTRSWKAYYAGAKQRAAEPVPTTVYQGLAPFQRGDADRFYGRDTEIDALLALLNATLVGDPGMIALVAPSGAGKSSLLQAGLLPALEERGLVSFLGSRRWPTSVITPGPHPLSAMTREITHFTGLLDPGQELMAPADELRAAVASYTADKVGADTRLILVVDQFEEVFTLAGESERQTFIDVLQTLSEAGSSGPPPCAVVLGMRADFAQSCFGYPPLVEALQNRQRLLPAMTIPQLTEAIERPAAAAGVKVEPALVQLLLQDAGLVDVDGSTTRRSDAGVLPLLSHALRITWDKRRSQRGPLTAQAYLDVGRLRGAVEQTADGAWKELTELQQAAALWMLLNLVHIGAGPSRDTRMSRDWRELLDSATHPGAAEQARDVLVRERLLTADTDTVTITHEALMQSWPRLADAIDNHRDGLAWRQRVDDAATAWEQSRTRHRWRRIVDDGRDPDLLWRGADLESALEWAARATDLDRPSAPAQLFLRRSARKRRLGKSIVVGVIGVLIASLVLVATTSIEARHREQDAVFENAVAQADRMHGSDLSLEALLDTAAYRARPTPYLYTRLIQSQEEALSAPLRGHTLSVNAVRFSPDGRYVASASGDHSLRLWSVTRPDHPQIGQPLRRHSDSVNAVAWSPDGRILASGGDDHTVYLWSVADPDHAAVLAGPLTLPGGVNDLAFSPDGHTLAGATRGTGAVCLINVVDPAHPALLGSPLPAHTRAGAVHIDANSVSFTPDGRTLAGGDDDGTARLWDVTDPAQPAARGEPILHPAGVTSVSFSPDGRILATGSMDHMLRLWNLTTPAPALLGLQTAGSGPVLGVAYSPDGNSVATSNDDHTARLWNVADPSRPSSEGPALVGHTGPVWTLMWSPDGRTLATGGEDSTVRLWTLPPVLDGHASAVNALALSRDGHLLVSGGDDHTVRLWHADGDRATPIGEPLTVGGGVTALALSNDGQLLVALCGDNTVRFWRIGDPAHPVPIGPAVTTPEPATGLALSPDGRAMAIATGGSLVRLYDLSALLTSGTTEVMRSTAFAPTDSSFVAGRVSGSADVAWSPDGHTLAIAGDDNSVRLWDVTDLSHPVPGPALDGHIRFVRALAFTADGHTLASAGDDGSVRLWDTTDPSHAHELGEPLRESTGPVFAVAWTPDGKMLVSGGLDGDVRMWDTTDRTHPGPLGAALSAHTDAVLAVTFGPEGRTLASAGRDATARLWNLDVDAAMRRICDSTANTVDQAGWSQLFSNVPFDQPCTGE